MSGFMQLSCIRIVMGKNAAASDIVSNCCFLNLSLLHARYVLVMCYSGQDVTPSSFNLDWTIFNTRYKIIFNFFVSFSLLLLSVMSATFVLNSVHSVPLGRPTDTIRVCVQELGSAQINSTQTSSDVGCLHFRISTTVSQCKCFYEFYFYVRHLWVS